MTIYLVKGYLDVAATSLTDAQALLTALSDPSDPSNASEIDRITGKLETLVQSDTGEPLVISSIDDAAGTISSWVTDASATLAVGLGDQDPNTAYSYTSTNSFSISGSTRVGTLALNTTSLRDRLSAGYPSIYGTSPLARGVGLFLHIRKTASGATETVALLPIRLKAGVLSATPEESAAISYTQSTEFLVGAIHPLTAITGLTGGGATALDGQATTSLPTGYTVFLSYGRVGQLWQLIAGTDAEDVSNGIVRPDDYHATTNARIWVQL